jgi:polyferredoxin
MKLENLKKVRVLVTLLFLFIAMFPFLDIFHLIPTQLFPYLYFLQFVPSAIKFFSQFSILASGFIIVIILTLLFGRIYCSSVCPLGTIQDIISRIALFLNKKKYFQSLNEYKILRYSILSATILSLFSSSFILLNLLDPFSLAGKIFSNIFRLGLIPLNNLAAFTLEQSN